MALSRASTFLSFATSNPESQKFSQRVPTMKGLLIALAAILALTHAAPQGVEFTAKEYQAFQQALGDRIPVAIQSAIRVLAGVESNPTEFVVLNFNGLSGPSARTGVPLAAAAPAAAPATGGVAIARTGSLSTDDDVAEIFNEVASDAVEAVQEAAEEAAEETEVEDEAVNRTGLAAEADNEAVAPQVVNVVSVAEVAEAIAAARRKRQDDVRPRRGPELALALSALGGLYARPVRRI